jgi:REP element-mobilizing transposase RayT
MLQKISDISHSMKQLKLFKNDYKKGFGGDLLVGKRKTKRPLSLKESIHLNLKSELKSVFNPSNISLLELIRRTAREFNIKIYDLALVWSHIHLVIKIKSREDYNAFIKVLTARIAIAIRKFKPEVEEVFTLRPFTRIISWGRDFKSVLNYLIINQMEAANVYWRKSKRNTKKKTTNTKRKPPA